MKAILVFLLILGCSKKSADHFCDIPDPHPMNLFSEDEVLNVHIKMNELDWKSLKAEEPPLNYHATNDLINSELTQYHWYKAKFYLNGNLVKRANVRKKSLIGSYSKTRPALKLKAESPFFDGRKRLTLNNNKQDSSYIHQCLSYKIFRLFGYPAPKCQIAHVCVNNERMGIYSSIEPIKKNFIQNNFGHRNVTVYEGNGHGNFHYDKRSDFYSSGLNYFERKSGSADWESEAPLQNFLNILENNDYSRKNDFTKIIDLNSYLKFISLEHLISHNDGYSNNNNNHYFIYNQNIKRIIFIPWGTDETLNSKTSKLYSNPRPVKYVLNAFRSDLRLMHDKQVEIWKGHKPQINSDFIKMKNLITPWLHDHEIESWTPHINRLQVYINDMETITSNYLNL